MRKFVGYIKNDKFAVGCTGQTVYVYDEKGNEIKRFKDIIYGYIPMFCPQKNIVVVKSTVGMLAAYSLDTMQLIKKFRFSKVNGSQDRGFCFSGDGKYLYNIEHRIDPLTTCISVYDTSEFKCIKRLFDNTTSIVLDYIEYDSNKEGFYVSGFTRGKAGVCDLLFIAQLKDEMLINITEIECEDEDFIHRYKHLESLGFTESTYEVSRFEERGYTLQQLKSMKVMLSDYIKESS